MVFIQQGRINSQLVDRGHHHQQNRGHIKRLRDNRSLGDACRTARHNNQLPDEIRCDQA